MNRYQSIISAIIGFICIFVVPRLNAHGIIIDEVTMENICKELIEFIAFCWVVWKNHNFTDAFYEAQLIGEEIKAQKHMEDEEA